jgi:hypothetical protein
VTTTASPAAPPEESVPRRDLPRWFDPRLALGAAGLLVLALVIVVWARTRPGFDPYGWLAWGHQTLLGSLDTNAAPSWKPLPYLFTVPFAIFGHYELWLWMITCVAVSLGGALAAGRIVYRLTLAGASPGDRRAPYAAGFAGLFAAAAVLEIRDWWHYMLSAQSDTMIVALCLAAIDAHLSKRPRVAFVLGGLAALGRPEVWPFLGLYAIWAWFKIPRTRRLLIGGIAVIALLWLGIPALTSRSPFVAASNAFGSGRRLRSDRVFGTIDRFLDLHETPLEIAALVSLALAAIRRDLVTATIGLGAVAWVIVEIAFSLHGWPGLGRYMFPAAGAMAVVAAVLVGRLLTELPELARRLRPTAAPAAAWTGLILAVALGVSLVPAAVSRGRDERRDLRSQRDRTKEINRLSAIIARLGGPKRLNACGEPLTRLEYQTVLAWTLRVNVSKIGFKYGQAIRHGNPLVLFTPLANGGWRLQGVHQVSADCRRLPH